MSNVYVHFSQISFSTRYSVVNFRLGSQSLGFRKVMIVTQMCANFIIGNIYVNGTPSVKVVQYHRDSGSVIPCRRITSDGIYTRSSLNVLPPASISLNTGIFSSPVQQAVGRLTWPVPLAWRHVNSILTPGMSAYLTCSLIWKWRGLTAATRR